MEASPRLHYFPNSAPAARKPLTKQPRFGGLADVASKVVGAIDSNRLLELVASDVTGFILPRTAIELKMRGPDSGRESFIRESTGLIGNALLAGWMGHLTANTLGSKVNPYLNPQGIPNKAWIGAENLHLFGNLYQDTLKKSGSTAEARRQFVTDILKNLQSTDRHLSLEGRLKSLMNSDIAQSDQGKLLAQMVETVHGKAQTAQKLPDYMKLLKKGDVDGLKDKFINADWGKLSPESVEALGQYFEPKTNPQALKGTFRFSEMAKERLKELKQQATETARRLKINPNFVRKTFIEERHKLSQQALHSLPDFRDAVDGEALSRGLTSTVKFLDTEQSRSTLLKDIKHFLEEYVDRAAHQAKAHVQKQGGTPAARLQAEREFILKRLTAESAQKPWQKLLPQAKDGLITATRKAKNMHTWIPMATALLASGVFTFYNNYMTMKKHGGKVFFPGEEGPPSADSNSPPAAKAPAQTPPTALPPPLRISSPPSLPGSPSFRPIVAFPPTNRPILPTIPPLAAAPRFIPGGGPSQ